MQSFLKKREKGSVIVMFALFMPLMMVCIGLAIDLGNLYSHYSRLQNAADAASLAGAREYAIQGETVYSHPYADAEAERYATGDAQDNNLKNAISGVYTVKQTDGGIIYFRARLTETVPLYFLRIVGLTDKTLTAESITALGGSVAYEKKPGNELFIVKSHFDAVNSVNNPDIDTKAGQISNVFEGNIVCTNGTNTKFSDTDAQNYVKSMIDRGDFQYSTQRGVLDHFFTPKAQTDNLSIGEALDPSINAKGEYSFDTYYQPYDMNELAVETRKKLGLPDYGSRTWENWSTYKENFSTVSDNKYLTSSKLGANMAITADMQNGDGNMAINIDGTIPGSSSDPVYLYIDESVNQRLNIDVTGDNGRPLIIVYAGTSEIAFNIASGTTFSGVVYAPNSTNLLVNAGGGNFRGSMVSDRLTLRGDNAKYTWVDYGVGSDGQGAKDVVVTRTSAIKLVSGEGIDWE